LSYSNEVSNLVPRVPDDVKRAAPWVRNQLVPKGVVERAPRLEPLLGFRFCSFLLAPNSSTEARCPPSVSHGFVSPRFGAREARLARLVRGTAAF
jgi:hypothetical protein